VFAPSIAEAILALGPMHCLANIDEHVAMGSASDQRRDGQLGRRGDRRAAAALGLAVLLAASTWPAVAIAAAPPGGAAFPPPLDGYTGEEGLSLLDVLARRARQEPMNVRRDGDLRPRDPAHVRRAQAPPGLASTAPEGGCRARPGAHSFVVELLHLLGEVEAVFGIWCIPLLIAIRLLKGPRSAEAFLGGVDFTERDMGLPFLGWSTTCASATGEPRASRTKPKYAAPRL